MQICREALPRISANISTEVKDAKKLSKNPIFMQLNFYPVSSINHHVNDISLNHDFRG
jgi:hypothetical protein